MDALIAATAERIFADHVDKALLDSAEHAFPDALWNVVREAGLHLVGSPQSGTALADLFGLLKIAGAHAVPLPLAEMLLGNAVLDDDLGEGFTTIAQQGVAPWGRAAQRVLTVDGALGTDFEVTGQGANLAGEARDGVRLRAAEDADVPPDFAEMLALSRAALMAGALSRVLSLAVGYATEREQFGRPIARFQAVQHQLAVLAGEVAAAGRAADAAVEALGSPGFVNQAAAAKARVGEAAGIAAEIAHQVFGAMGFTHEHVLHHFTRRLWAWRDEYGRESRWQERLGRRIAEGGAERLWDFIVHGG